MKLLAIVCVLVLSLSCLPLSCSALSHFSSSFKEYLLEREQALESFAEGNFWTDCTKPGDHGKIIDITLSPNPPKRDSDFTINTTLSLDEEVTSGKMSILITVGQLPFQQDYDLCEIMDDYGLSCPVKQGKFSFGLTMNIPGYVPGGDYGGKMITTDQNNERIFCVTFKMHID